MAVVNLESIVNFAYVMSQLKRQPNILSLTINKINAMSSSMAMYLMSPLFTSISRLPNGLNSYLPQKTHATKLPVTEMYIIKKLDGIW